MKRFKKGSAAAKRYMAKIYGMRKGSHVSKSRASRPRRIKIRRTTSLRRIFRRKGGNRGGSLMQSVEKLAKAGAFIAPGLARAQHVYAVEHNMVRAATEGLGRYAGLQDMKFDWSILAEAWTPVIAVSLASKGYHKLMGLIRRI